MPSTLLCLHETATSGAAWAPLAEALGETPHVQAPDRIGWGGSPAPEDYRATTVAEQAEAAASLLPGPGEPPALVAGAGIGAAIALDLLIGRPGHLAGAILIEPPLLAFVPDATAAISADRQALEQAVQAGGVEAGAELYLSGSLAGLGPGAERLPAELADRARERPASLFAELGAVPGWHLPFAALRTSALPSRVVVSEGTPRFVREACSALAERLAGCDLVELPGSGPAHLDAAPAVARLVRELSDAGGPSS